MTPKQTVAWFRPVLDRNRIAHFHEAAHIRMGTESLHVPISGGYATVLVDSGSYEIWLPSGYSFPRTTKAEQVIKDLQAVLEGQEFGT